MSPIEPSGSALGTFVITTATEHLTAQQRERHPSPARVSTARTGARGIPPLPWGGR